MQCSFKNEFWLGLGVSLRCTLRLGRTMIRSKNYIVELRFNHKLNSFSILSSNARQNLTKLGAATRSAQWQCFLFHVCDSKSDRLNRRPPLPTLLSRMLPVWRHACLQVFRRHRNVPTYRSHLPRHCFSTSPCHRAAAATSSKFLKMEEFPSELIRWELC